MSAEYRTLADKPFESHYLWEEIDIDASAEVVFARARLIGGWMGAHRLETIDGTAGEVGHFERVYTAELPPETPHPHYHLYGIAHLIPNRYIALEVFRERGGSYGVDREWVSLDGIILTELEPGRTRVVFQIIEVHQGTSTPDEAAEIAAELDELRHIMQPYLGTLKAQAEADSAPLN